MQDETLATLARVWYDNPELRLGQLIANAASIVDKDIFFIPDGTLEYALDRLNKNYNKLDKGHYTKLIEE